jgi:hypothetical protein
MRKWKLLFVNGCESKSLCFTEMEFLNLCKGGTNSPTCVGMLKMLKDSDISLNECPTFTIVIMFYLIFMT